MRAPSGGPTRSATLINGIGQLRRTRGGPALPRVAVQSATERPTAPPRLMRGLRFAPILPLNSVYHLEWSNQPLEIKWAAARSGGERRMLEALFGSDMPLAVRFFLAFLIVLGLIGATAWAVRRFGAGRLGGAGTRGRQPRLAVVDYASVDSRRRLILVRRDNIEHLVLIGGPTDVVVEANIVRAAPATREATRHVRRRRRKRCRERPLCRKMATAHGRRGRSRCGRRGRHRVWSGRAGQLAPAAVWRSTAAARA